MLRGSIRQGYMWRSVLDKRCTLLIKNVNFVIIIRSTWQLTELKLANMKNLTCHRGLLFSLILSGLFLACSDDTDEAPTPIDPSDNIIPEKFSVAVPSALTIGTNPNGRTNNDDLSGNSIYEALGLFIKLGEESAEVTEAIILGIRSLDITGATEGAYLSADDERNKRFQTIEGATYEGTNYEFELLITDIEDEGNDDSGKAMQIFWNTNPVEGVAILKPYNIDRSEPTDSPEAIYKLEYQSESDMGYDAHMIVSISGLTFDPEEDPYGVDNLKMFVGRTGETVDVFGNSNHPQAQFFTDDTGFNWAFVASGSDEKDLGVAEVGLPPSTLNSTDRTEILETYSMRNVFSSQILEEFPLIGQELIDQYLNNTFPPGYFNDNGFVQGGESPGEEWDEFESRITDLAPYNPSSISGQEISFQ